MTTNRRSPRRQSQPADRTAQTAGTFINAGISMLGPAGVPRDYGHIETASDVLEAIEVKPPELTVRLHIMWDIPLQNVDESLQRALEEMRAYGAAMVTKVVKL